jgi:hypothetical protein
VPSLARVAADLESVAGKEGDPKRAAWAATFVSSGRLGSSLRLRSVPVVGAAVADVASDAG